MSNKHGISLDHNCNYNKFSNDQIIQSRAYIPHFFQMQNYHHHNANIFWKNDRKDHSEVDNFNTFDYSHRRRILFCSFGKCLNDYIARN